MNLIKRCENCVYSNVVTTDYPGIFRCIVSVPAWVERSSLRLGEKVTNEYAKNCDLFRLRETGVNE